MPPLPPVPNAIKVQLLGQSGEATEIPWSNVFHIGYTGGAPSSGDIGSLASAISTAWNTHMAPECVSNVTLIEVVCTDLSSATSAVGADATVRTGTRGDDEIPAQVAYLVTYPVLRRYRGGHPRQYLIVGGDADFLDAAHWSNAFTAEVATHWLAFLDSFLGATYGALTIGALLNVSYYETDYTVVPPKRVRRAVPQVDTLNASHMVGHQQMATQRRRIGRHRR